MSKWRKVKLGEFVKIQTGKLDANASIINGKYPFFTCSVKPLRINSFSYDCKCVLVAGNGDLNVKYYEGKFDAYQRTYIIESLDTKVLDTKFLHLFLEKYVSKLRQLSIGGVIKYIKLNNLTDPLIPLPPLSEQQRIVSILDKANSLIEKRKKAIDLLDEYLKTVFLDMFGDPVTNPMGWEMKQLKYFGEIITGNTPSRKEPNNFTPEFIEWIKTDNIIEDQVYLSKASEYLSESGLIKGRQVDKGALLVACIAGSIDSIGRSAIADRKVSFNQQINAIQPQKDVNSIFLYWLFKLCRKYVQEHATKGMKRILTKGSFEKIKMILPPVKSQEEFSFIAAKHEKNKKLSNTQLIELELNFRNILNSNFNEN